MPSLLVDRFRRSDYLTYRILTVPRQIHQSLDVSEQSPIHASLAKNLGIRFARGEYVLAANNGNRIMDQTSWLC
jgi:hypothetical protein